jgi:imidazolonepropionase-like amidohydrolase
MMDNKYAIVGALLIDGTGGEPLKDSLVLVEDGKIAKVTTQKGGKIPAGYKVVNGKGKSLLPGFMDMHIHFIFGDKDIFTPASDVVPGLVDHPALKVMKSYTYALRTVRAGFTTVRDVGGSDLIIQLRNAINQGIVEGPRMICCNQLLTTTSGHGDWYPSWLVRTDGDEVTYICNGAEEVLHAVRRQIKQKADWIKIYATGGLNDAFDEQEFTDEEMSVMIREAHSKGKPVCAHAMHIPGTLAAVKAGIDSVEHGSRLNEEIVDLMVKKGIYLVPTLYVAWGAATQGEAFGLPKKYVDVAKKTFEIGTESFRLAYKKGVKIALGTDCGTNMVTHGSNAKEFELLVEMGMTPMEAIQAGTSAAAEMLRMSDRIGTVEEGKLADLVLVDGNPLDQIKILQQEQSILMVMKEGRLMKETAGLIS